MEIIYAIYRFATPSSASQLMGSMVPQRISPKLYHQKNVFSITKKRFKSHVTEIGIPIIYTPCTVLHHLVLLYNS